MDIGIPEVQLISFLHSELLIIKKPGELNKADICCIHRFKKSI